MIVNEFDSYYEMETSFRLLNSEIGNDHETYLNWYDCFDYGFRLLNSEIGNDRTQFVAIYLKGKCFRLLNSEIGNDHDTESL